MAPKDIMTNSHAKSILNAMNSLRKSNTLCDITLRVESTDFPAHRIVLAACSDYFCAMFTSEVTELCREKNADLFTLYFQRRERFTLRLGMTSTLLLVLLSVILICFGLWFCSLQKKGSPLLTSKGSLQELWRFYWILSTRRLF